MGYTKLIVAVLALAECLALAAFGKLEYLAAGTLITLAGAYMAFRYQEHKLMSPDDVPTNTKFWLMIGAMVASGVIAYIGKLNYVIAGAIVSIAGLYCGFRAQDYLWQNPMQKPTETPKP